MTRRGRWKRRGEPLLVPFFSRGGGLAHLTPVPRPTCLFMFACLPAVAGLPYPPPTAYAATLLPVTHTFCSTCGYYLLPPRTTWLFRAVCLRTTACRARATTLPRTHIPAASRFIHWHYPDHIHGELITYHGAATTCRRGFVNVAGHVSPGFTTVRADKRWRDRRTTGHTSQDEHAQTLWCVVTCYTCCRYYVGSSGGSPPLPPHFHLSRCSRSARSALSADHCCLPQTHVSPATKRLRIAGHVPISVLFVSLLLERGRLRGLGCVVCGGLTLRTRHGTRMWRGEGRAKGKASLRLHSKLSHIRLRHICYVASGFLIRHLSSTSFSLQLELHQQSLLSQTALSCTHLLLDSLLGHITPVCLQRSLCPGLWFGITPAR